MWIQPYFVEKAERTDGPQRSGLCCMILFDFDTFYLGLYGNRNEFYLTITALLHWKINLQMQCAFWYAPVDCIISASQLGQQCCRARSPTSVKTSVFLAWAHTAHAAESKKETEAPNVRISSPLLHSNDFQQMTVGTKTAFLSHARKHVCFRSTIVFSQLGDLLVRSTRFVTFSDLWSFVCVSCLLQYHDRFHNITNSVNDPVFDAW